MISLIKQSLQSPTTNTMFVLMILGIVCLFIENWRGVGLGILGTLASIIFAAFMEGK